MVKYLVMRLFYLLFIYIIGFGLSSCEDELQNWIDENPIIQESMKFHPEQNEVCLIPNEEMPRFPGCEDLTIIEERKACADKKMLEFIYQNFKFPLQVGCHTIEGIIIISFIVEKNGSLSNFQIIRKLEGGLDEEGLRIAQAMPNFIPGRDNGQSVRTRIYLPIRIRLE